MFVFKSSDRRSLSVFFLALCLKLKKRGNCPAVHIQSFDIDTSQQMTEADKAMLFFGCICFDAKTLEGKLSTGQLIEVVGYKDDATQLKLDSKNDTEALRDTLVKLDAKDDYVMGLHFMNGKGGKMEKMHISFNKKETTQQYFSIYCKFKEPADVKQLFDAIHNKAAGTTETAAAEKKAKKAAKAAKAAKVLAVGLERASAILETIDYSDVFEYDEARKQDAKRRKLDNLAEKASEAMTCKETLAIAMAAVRYAFGQWPDTMDKHNMAEAATEFAAEMVAAAGELKLNKGLKCCALAQKMDDEEIRPE